LFKNGAKAISQKMLKNTTLKILAYERVGEALETAKIIPIHTILLISSEKQKFK
jgi:hypothetical protein